MKIFFVNENLLCKHRSVNMFLKTTLVHGTVYVEQGNIIIVLRSFIKNM